MLQRLRDPALAPLIVAAAAAASLGGAFTLQYGFGLWPCQLCIWQRWPWGVAGLLALLTLLSARGGRMPAWPVALAAAVVAAGGGIAVFHAGVEQHWWQGFTSCTGVGGGAASLDDLRAQVMAAPVVRCDDIQGSFLGVSLAGWNAILSFAVAALAGDAARRLWRGSGR